MRKRERQEKILSSTLSESLILFLFILLAITSIYKTKVNEYHKTLTENKVLPPGYKSVLEGARILQSNEKAIDKSDYNQLISDAKKGSMGSNTLTQLQNLKKKIKELELQGVNAPPCVLANNKQVLFEVDFDVDILKNKIYHLTFKNLPEPINFDEFYVFNGYEVKMNHTEFKKFGNAVIESNKINENDDYCCCEQRKISSAYCTRCVYVFARKPPNRTGIFGRKGIGEDLALEMNDTVQKYFLPSLTKKKK